MRVTEAALDAAAKAIYQRHHGIDWDNETEEIRAMFLRDANDSLAAAAPFLAGAAGLDPECGCALKACAHRPALTEEGRHKVMAGRPTPQQQKTANVIVGLNNALGEAYVNAARHPIVQAFNNDMANFGSAIRQANQNGGRA